MSAALIAYRWPGLSRFTLAHVVTERAEPLPSKPKGGRHAGAHRKRGRRLPKWLRRGARTCGDPAGRWWLDAGEVNPALLDKWQAQFRPVTAGTQVSYPALPFAEVAGKPPWAVSTRKTARMEAAS